MSELLSGLRDLYAFAASRPYVVAACVAGVGGLLLVIGAGRRER